MDRWEDMNEVRIEGLWPEATGTDIEEATTQNRTFRTAMWTESTFRSLMSIDVGEDIGVENHRV